MENNFTKEWFIQRALSVHGDKYAYDKVVYKNSRTSVIINCQVHGDFSQKPDKHLRGQGCRKCFCDNAGNHNRLSTINFVDKAMLIHGNKYNYDKVIYKNFHTLVEIECPIHGCFWQTPANHISRHKRGCLKCSYVKRGIASRANIDEFVEKAIVIHGNRYIYDKVKYYGNREKVEIGCHAHGYFWQSPNNHLFGYGCAICGRDDIGNAVRYTVDEFICKSREIHGCLYDYSQVKYVNCNTRVIIGCPIHGNFEQAPALHISGARCTICRESRGEICIRKYLIDNDISFKSQYRFKDCRNKKPLPFDFVVYYRNLVKIVEYNGAQHYFPVNFGGSDTEECHKRYERCVVNDNIKKKWCSDNNIPFLIIPYTEYVNIDLILNSFLGGKLSQKLQAMCDHCNWRRVADASQWSDLREVPGCSACHGKKYKCPDCGYTVKARKFTVPMEDKPEPVQTTRPVIDSHGTRIT